MSYQELSNLIEKLRELNEVDLLEVLELTSDDLLSMCVDRVVELQDKLYRYVENK